MKRLAFRRAPSGASASRFRLRLVATVVALVGLAGALGFVGILQLGSVDGTYHALVNREARLVKDILEMKNALSEQVVGARGFIISDGSESFLEPFHRGSSQFLRELDDARGKAETQRDHKLLESIEAGYRDLRPVYLREIALVRLGRAAEAEALAEAVGKPRKDAIARDLQILFDRQEDDLYEDADATADRARIEMIALLGAAAIIGALLAAFVWRLSSALSRALAEQKALALVDPLTGLANHRHFHGRLAEEFARARRHDRDLSLAVLDIDHFKRVNDSNGHPAGDAVLRETANRLRALARADDLLARVGGEEFAWIMPETDEAAAHMALERARKAFSSTPFAGVGHLSLSGGVCSQSWADAPADLYRLADGALYWAKGHGRDAGIVYSPEVVKELSAVEHAERLERGNAKATILALASAVDAKDPLTRQHSERVAELAGCIAREMGWDPRCVSRLKEAGLVHDVGKIGVPDAVLFKPAGLTPEEFEQVKAHAALGAQIVSEALDVEQVAWVRGHHERFNGTGYPDGLAGADISLGARILAVADAWDVMTSERVYSEALTPEEALAECRRGVRRQFCPQVVEAFLGLHEGSGLPPRDVEGTPALSEAMG